MTVTWGPITYPVSLDAFAALTDGVDEVVANHPNSVADAVVALQTKLAITGGVATGFGGISFEWAGKAANPGAPFTPTLWVNNSLGPGYPLMYTDENGMDWNLLSGIGAIDLQTAYDNGPAIVCSVVSGGPVTITIPNNENVTAFIITNDDVTNKPVTFVIENNVCDTFDSSAVSLYFTGEEYQSLYSRKSFVISALNDIHLVAGDSGNGFYFYLGNVSACTQIAEFITSGILFEPLINTSFTVTTSGAGGSVWLNAVGGDLKFTDQNRTGSTWAQTHVLLSDTTAEWDLYESYFGEVSLMNAICQASWVRFVNDDVDIGTETIDSFDPDVTDTYRAGVAVWHYCVVKNGNMRAGFVTATWDATAGTVSYAETKTADLGDTSDVIVFVDMDAPNGNIRLRATAAAINNWAIRGFRNFIVAGVPS